MKPLQVTPEISSGIEAILAVVLYFAVVGLGGYFFGRSSADFWITSG
jgi:hypothetical protein